MPRLALRSIATGALIAVSALTAAATTNPAPDVHAARFAAAASAPSTCTDPMWGHSWDATAPTVRTAASTSGSCDVPTTNGHSWD